MTQQFRADQVGSLLRPAALLAARQDFQAGALTREQLRQAEDDAIRHVLGLQREAGIDVLSDGEFRRSGWGGGFMDTVEGLTFQEAAARPTTSWKGAGAEVANESLGPMPVVTGALRMPGRFTATEAGFLAANASRPFKITLPSPTMMLSFWQAGRSEAAYASQDAMIDDLVGIYQREVAALVGDGVPYIQIDSLRYIDLIDERRRMALQGRGVTSVLERILAADNAVLAKAKHPAVTRGVHICRGNHRSSWFGEGGYDAIAEALFAELDTDRFLLEFDDDRSGGFAPLRFVPPGKTVVLGLVTTKSGALEDPDHLVRRIDAATKYLPLDQLAISPQCGFASTQFGNLLTEEEEQRKLALVASTARRVWGST